jgi:hypothetical protein
MIDILQSLQAVAQTLFSFPKRFFINLSSAPGDFKTRHLGSNR